MGFQVHLGSHCRWFMSVGVMAVSHWCKRLEAGLLFSQVLHLLVVYYMWSSTLVGLGLFTGVLVGALHFSFGGLVG